MAWLLLICTESKSAQLCKQISQWSRDLHKPSNHHPINWNDAICAFGAHHARTLSLLEPTIMLRGSCRQSTQLSEYLSRLLFSEPSQLIIMKRDKNWVFSSSKICNTVLRAITWSSVTWNYPFHYQANLALSTQEFAWWFTEIVNFML